MSLLHKLYLLRFSLIAAFLLAGMPIVIFCFGIAKPLLAGLYDLPTFRNMAWATFFGYFLSWTVVATLKMTLIYGPERCDFPKSTKPRLIEKLYVSQMLFGVALLLPLPFLLAVEWSFDGGWHQLYGAAVGFLAASVLAFAFDCVQRLFNQFHGDDRSEVAKQLFFPFRNPVSDRAGKSERVFGFFNNSFFKSLSGRLRDIDPKYGTGYLGRTNGKVVIYPGTVLCIVMAGCFLGIYLVGNWFWTRPFLDNGVPVDMEVTALTYVFVVTTLLCWILSGTAFFFDRYRIPTILILCGFLALASLNHKYDVSNTQGDEPELSTPAQAMDARKDAPYIILVAANGGGIQAAAWTAEVLSGLNAHCREIDQRPDGCGNSIALISSVSGGSVGTMYFLDAYDDEKGLVEERLNNIGEYTKRSSLDYVAGGMVFDDLIRNVRYADRILSNDRGKQLERSWKENKERIDGHTIDGLSAIDSNLSRWRNGVSAGKRPAVIFNSTIVETGQRMLFTTSEIEPVRPAPSGWLTFDKITGGKKDIKITTAVRLSASFPYVSPAARMNEARDNTAEEFHLVDGGYYDNYGVSSLIDWLHSAFTNSATFKKENKKKPKILIIEIIGEEVYPKYRADPEVPESLSNTSYFAQIYAPLKTLLGVRTTGQLTHNDAELDFFTRYWALNNDIEIKRFTFEYSFEKDAPPLSWHLTEREKTKLADKAAEIFKEEIPGKTQENWKGLKRSIQDSLLKFP